MIVFSTAENGLVYVFARVKKCILFYILGYFYGLVICFFAKIVMQVAQPALIYLVPCTLVPVILYSCYDGLFCQLWDGSFGNQVEREHKTMNAKQDEITLQENSM